MIKRSFIKKNEITEREIEFNVITAIESLVWDHRKTGSVKLNQQTKVQIVKDGINKLLQKDIIRKPDFVSAPEVEAIAKGMWNVANNKEFDSYNKGLVNFKLFQSTSFIYGY